ncbi:MAG: 16S rRNA (guanine(527)-N(7))-methyltransferase RsmG, partial [Flavobacteriales bacterium]|nr:16S rRNA (guanine(527)-N(7))-methyltransferase RsmG [Flavobacteriales bacterium]
MKPSIKIITNYFPDLTETQLEQFSMLEPLYKDWNAQINVISRKDIDELYIKHVLHSLAIAKVVQFKAKTKVLDVGTGGGFPGIPLAIMFPECSFHLVDSINKKLKVVNGIAEDLGLTNIKTSHARVEAIDDYYDFIVSRAVTAMPMFVSWVKKKVSKKSNHEVKNGILYLKGGDLTEELQAFPKATLYDLSDYFEEDFFDTK